jgi:hypothetical protein
VFDAEFHRGREVREDPRFQPEAAFFFCLYLLGLPDLNNRKNGRDITGICLIA